MMKGRDQADDANAKPKFAIDEHDEPEHEVGNYESSGKLNSEALELIVPVSLSLVTMEINEIFRTYASSK